MARSREGSLVHLFDGHIYIFRAYYSLPPMYAPDGTPTNAAYGFANTLMKYVTDCSPTHVGVCFDYAMESFRNEIEPEYKAGRGEPPDDLEPQFDLCREVAEALGFAVFEKEGFEADDIVATLSRDIVRRGGRVRVVSSDKDLAQLVREDGRVVIYDLARQCTLDAQGVRDKFGVDPGQIPDYLGLVGDSVDNLPGVPGIGPKSAAAILGAFKSIELVPDDAEAWSGVSARGVPSLAARIAQHRARALRTKSLATLCSAVPDLATGLRALAHRGALYPQVYELFERLGWERIQDRIAGWS